jgi:hypothetical protein
VASAILSFSDGSDFAPYFGGANPVAMTMLVVVLGAVSLGVLHSRDWFRISNPDRRRGGLRWAVALASLFALSAVTADLLGAFPPDINVPLPRALLFYPLMGLAAEVAFHLIPLTLLLMVGTGFGAKARPKLVLWTCLVLVASVEAVFQVALSPEGSAPWAHWFVAGHLFAFGLAQMWIFRSYDFLTMYALRLVYYGYWHLAWGWIRLSG